MLQTLVLLISLAGGSLDSWLPDNTCMVVSFKPSILAETPAFALIKKNLLSATGMAQAAEELESIAKIRFFEDVDEVILIVPHDFTLRKNDCILIRGNLRLDGILKLAAAKKMDIDDSDKAKACILSIPGSKGKAAAILEDGSLMIASRPTIEKTAAGTFKSREGRLDQSMTAALAAADWDSMVWGALVVPGDLSAAGTLGSGLPLAHIERAHFHMDAANGFSFSIHLVLKDTMKPEAFISAVQDKLAKRLPDDLRMAKAGPNSVHITFSFTASKMNEYLASMIR